MKSIYTVILLSFLSLVNYAQDPILDSWIVNTTGKTSSYWENVGMGKNTDFQYTTSTKLADATQACFSSDSIWIESEGITNDMGPFLNPETPSGQGYVFSFPRNLLAWTGTEAVPETV
jgi:hypothetical protein